MTTTSAASTLGDSWKQRLPYDSQEFAPEPAAQGMRVTPPSLGPLDLPEGKVLMVVEDTIVPLLQRFLHEAGWPVVGPATTVNEIQRIIQCDDIDCAILDFDVDRRAPLPIADLLAFADVPFVYLTTAVLGPVPVWHRHRPVVEKPFTREALLAGVEKAIAKPREGTKDSPWLGGLVVPWTRVYPPL